MNIDLIKIGLIILIPALFIMIICLLFIIPDVYSEEWHFEDEETLPPTPKEKLIEYCFKLSLYACCFSAYIFAFAFYFKTFYLLSIFLALAPIWVLWDRK